MGCSSSAHVAGTPPGPVHATDTHNEIMEDLAIKEPFTMDMEATRINVLPMCDNIEKIGVDRHVQSTVDQNTKSDDFFKDDKDMNMDTNEKNEGTSKVDVDNASQVEDRLSKLEEVVEKVVELYINENNHNSNTDLISKNSEQEIMDASEEDPTNEQTGSHENSETEGVEAVSVEARAGEAGGGATATRWEALADIAAELPPSLAVDPLTGQIYTLSK